MTFLTESDLAERLGVPESTVTEWRRRYSWPHMKIGKRVRFSEADVRAIELQHHVKPAKADALPDQTPRSAARSAS